MTETSAFAAAPAEPAPTPGKIRRGAAIALRAVGIVTVLAIVVQFVFAGLGAYGASLDAHRALGGFIAILAVVMLVIALIARPSWTIVALAVLLVLLSTAGQSVLARLGEETDAWFGGIHALNGLVILGLTARITSGATGRTKHRTST